MCSERTGFAERPRAAECRWSRTAEAASRTGQTGAGSRPTALGSYLGRDFLCPIVRMSCSCTAGNRSHLSCGSDSALHPRLKTGAECFDPFNLSLLSPPLALHWARGLCDPNPTGFPWGTNRVPAMGDGAFTIINGKMGFHPAVLLGSWHL